MAYIGDSQGAAEIDPNAFIKWLSGDNSEGGNRTGKRWPCCAVQVFQKSAVISFDTIQFVYTLLAECLHACLDIICLPFYHHCLPRFHQASTPPVLSRNQRLGRSSVTDHFWWRSLYGDTDPPNRVSVRVLNIRIGVRQMKRWVLCIKAMRQCGNAMCFCKFSQLAGPAAGHGTCRFRGVALHLLQLLDPKGWLTAFGEDSRKNW